MVGLSIVLEAHNWKNATTSTATPTTKKTFMPLVLSKATMVKPPPTHLPPPPPPAHPTSAGAAARRFHHLPVGGSFLDACFLCRQRLLPGKDIYMYKGDKAFCSEECRWKQMLMDEYEEENPNNYNNKNNNPLNNNNNSSLKLLEKSPNYNCKDNFCSLAATKPPAAAASSSSATKPRHQRLHRWNPFTT